MVASGLPALLAAMGSLIGGKRTFLFGYHMRTGDVSLDTPSVARHFSHDRPVLFRPRWLLCWNWGGLPWNDPLQGSVERGWRFVTTQFARQFLEFGGLLRGGHLAFHERQCKPGHGLRKGSWRMGTLIGLMCLLDTANASVDRALHGCVRTVRMTVPSPNSGSALSIGTRFACSGRTRTGPSTASGTFRNASARAEAAFIVLCDAFCKTSTRNPFPLNSETSGLSGDFQFAPLTMPMKVCDKPRTSSPMATISQ